MTRPHVTPQVQELTQSNGVIDAEAAENFLDVPSVKETVSSDHHLERF